MVSRVLARTGVALTIWLSRLAAPRPVGPAPMTRISTDLFRSAIASKGAMGRGALQVRHFASKWESSDVKIVAKRVPTLGKLGRPSSREEKCNECCSKRVWSTVGVRPKKFLVTYSR